MSFTASYMLSLFILIALSLYILIVVEINAFFGITAKLDRLK